MAFSDKESTGNTANAKRAAASCASASTKSRQAIFTTLPHTDSLATANINTIFQLINGIYAIVLYEKKLMVRHVITFYEKGGDKASRHLWVSNTSSVGTISWISMQLWVPLSSPNTFKSSVQSGLPKYGLVHSMVFLYALMPKVITLREDGLMKLDTTIYNSVFRPLNIKEGAVVQAVKALMGRKQANDADDSRE
ncbi:hypothetical protein CCMSSC00406_0008184 [Pleurotus cornucopiae]|uniref:Uncharacterized protein n=1 Tax=Pleurotus cornucopiae TaxID=5321 RepID=A0ACB7IQ33_PLECO|nr:hypothetical protein CCMSSC00406_0008184 [Pleurotus cornucopiae]